MTRIELGGPLAALRGGRDRPKRSARATPSLGFSAFCAFYMVAFLLDATEDWEAPLLALATVVAVAVIHGWGVTRWSFLAFLVASTAYNLVVDFPDPSNHNNIALVCNIFLVVVILYASRRPELAHDDEALFEVLKPPLRVSLALIYVLAGFHKLNTDFFNDDVGCAEVFFRLMTLHTPLADLGLSGGALVAFGVSVIFWELGGGVMLWFRRTQPVMLVMSLIGHAILAELNIFDFSSLAFALLLTFVPAAYWTVLSDSSEVRIGRIRIDRVGFYVWINVAMAVLAGINYQLLDPWSPFHRFQGLALNIGVAVFVWPMIRQALRRSPRIAWSGVPIWGSTTPKLALLLPVFVLFFGLNPYLGLRNAGTFTMFSNLQVEADRSNHLLLGSNPLEVSDLHEDTVTVIEIDPAHARKAEDAALSAEYDLSGNELHVVEFQKRIVDWRAWGLDGLAATYEYDGRRYETDDLANDNPWNVEGHRPIHYLLDFRLLQTSGPVICRW